MSRATPMPPEERRAAIIEAARPLLARHGTDFTTRQVAEAAGIAEGTIFRVFSSIAELQEAIIDDLMDAGTTQKALGRIGVDSPLDDRVAEVIATVQHLVRESAMLFGIAHRSDIASEAHGECRKARFEDASAAVVQSIERILAPDAAAFKVPVNQAAAMLRSLAIASVHPLLGTFHPTDLAILTDMFLNGTTKEIA